MSEPSSATEPCPDPDCDGVLAVTPGRVQRFGVSTTGPEGAPERVVPTTGRCETCGRRWERYDDDGPWQPSQEQ